MADGEDGYGDPEKVKDTVKKFMQTGAAGINLEDQIHDGKTKISVINENLMAQKIISARETAELEENPDFIINARTDALRSTENRSEGLKIAISRANQYIESGADLVFIAYVETIDDVKVIKQEVNGPISIAAGMPYNIENFSINDLKKQGISRISLPTLLILSSLGAIRKSLKSINEDNMFKTAKNGFQYPVHDLNSL